MGLNVEKQIKSKEWNAIVEALGQIQSIIIRKKLTQRIPIICCNYTLKKIFKQLQEEFQNLKKTPYLTKSW